MLRSLERRPTEENFEQISFSWLCFRQHGTQNPHVQFQVLPLESLQRRLTEGISGYISFFNFVFDSMGLDAPGLLLQALLQTSLLHLLTRNSVSRSLKCSIFQRYCKSVPFCRELLLIMDNIRLQSLMSALLPQHLLPVDRNICWHSLMSAISRRQLLGMKGNICGTSATTGYCYPKRPTDPVY